MGPTASERSPLEGLSGGYPRFPPRATKRGTAAASARDFSAAPREGRGKSLDGTPDPIPLDSPQSIPIPPSWLPRPTGNRPHPDDIGPHRHRRRHVIEREFSCQRDRHPCGMGERHPAADDSPIDEAEQPRPRLVERVHEHPTASGVRRRGNEGFRVGPPTPLPIGIGNRDEPRPCGKPRRHPPKGVAPGSVDSPGETDFDRHRRRRRHQPPADIGHIFKRPLPAPRSSPQARVQGAELPTTAAIAATLAGAAAPSGPASGSLTSMIALPPASASAASPPSRTLTSRPRQITSPPPSPHSGPAPPVWRSRGRD